MPGQQAPKVHLGWVTLLAVTGFVITALAFGARFVTDLGGEDLAVWQSILTNFGVGLLSAAVLLLFEPKFRRAVSDTVNMATAGVREEVREAVQADIDERLGPLTDRINSLYDEKIAAQQAALKDLSRSFTHDSVVTILTEADDAGALRAKTVRVQADPRVGWLHIEFELRLPDETRNRIEAIGLHPAEEGESLFLKAFGVWGFAAEIRWAPGRDFAGVALELATQLSRSRERSLNDRIDWEAVLSRFEGAVKVALDSNNRVPGALHFLGVLLEVAGPDSAPWYIASDGVYYPSRDWYLSRWDIYSTNPGRPAKPLVLPEWANPDEWRYVATAALSYYKGD